MGAWYVFVCPRYAAVLVPFAIGCAVFGRMVPRPVVVGVAAVAWTAQFVGHARFERRAPAFTDNLLQLLVGPAYVVALMMGDWPPAGERDTGAIPTVTGGSEASRLGAHDSRPLGPIAPLP